MYGHHFGDELLKAIALRIRQTFGSDDIVAHIGGNTFAVLLAKAYQNQRNDNEQHTQTLLDAFETRFHIGSIPLTLSASVGFVQWPDHGQSAELLMHRVELAMYKAKEQVGNYCEPYHQSLEDAIKDKLSLEQDIKRALRAEEFVLHFQPQIDLATSKAVAAEALVRWQHPERGLLSPFYFIEAMEEAGLIGQMDNWGLEQACRHIRQLLDSGRRFTAIAVNLSAQKYSDPDLVDQVYSLLKAHNIPPELLELEITESMAMQNIEASQRTIRHLRQLGVTLAIDDFGTGHSSLSYLTVLDIDILKIDCSFIKNIPHNSDDMAVASAIIAIAKQLNLKIIAEGVETEEQRQFLLDQGCDFAQGHLFSHPIPYDQFADFLSA